MELPTERPPPMTAAAARRVLFGFGVRELGVGLGAVAMMTLAVAWYRHDAREHAAEANAFRARAALAADAADVYRDRLATLRAQAERLHRDADATAEEPARSWARERARRFDALVAALDRDANAEAFAQAAHAADEAARAGDFAGAKARLAAAVPPVFPPGSEFERLRHDLYEAPLAEYSRQSPELYRTFRAREPDLARADEQALRAEIAAETSGTVTPQAMLKADLLAAVASPDDPLIADWAAMASAMDNFENPDAATLAAWRKAQRAMRANDWPTAAAELMVIAKSTARTRQPFRAVLGRTILRSRPQDPIQAYPFVADAAAAGDNEARAWVAAEDVRQRRFPQAQRSLEAAVTDGDTAAVPALLALYEQHGNDLAGDLSRRVALLERVTQRPDAPVDAMVALGRLYERVDPQASAAKASACYRRAAAKGNARANLELARCLLKPQSSTPDLADARAAAIEAFRGGEREGAASLLGEIMRRAPGESASPIAELLGSEAVATKVPYVEVRTIDGPGVMALRAQLARYFDRHGNLLRAAQFYRGVNDVAAERRHRELTASRPCETCGGSGKIQELVDCPTCGGSGKQLCSFCGGTGVIYAPGSPPCATCGGSGTMVQNRKVVTCGACGGTGKGQGSVIPQPCTHCEHGYIRCAECTNGKIRVSKECPDCHGHGVWTLIDRTNDDG